METGGKWDSVQSQAITKISRSVVSVAAILKVTVSYRLKQSATRIKAVNILTFNKFVIHLAVLTKSSG